MGDRGAIFEADPHTKTEFYWLATRACRSVCGSTDLVSGNQSLEDGALRRTGHRRIRVRQFRADRTRPGVVTNCSDETELFTDDPAIVAAFKTSST
jgi:hypothetical protein